MQESISAFEAKAHFARLLDRVERGEEIVIMGRGKPVARLVPMGTDHDVDASRAAAGWLRALTEEIDLAQLPQIGD